MIEVVFGESACGSLRVAQNYGKGKYRGGAVSVFIQDSDRKASAEEIRAAQLRAEAQAREAWENAIPMNGQQKDIYCFSLALSIGDISDGGIGERRREVLRHLLSIDPSVDLREQADINLQNTAAALSDLIERYVAGEAIRIWYSHNPDELCGMYWLMSQLRLFNLQTPIYLVKLPLWEYGVGVGRSRPYFVGSNEPYFVGKLGANRWSFRLPTTQIGKLFILALSSVQRPLPYRSVVRRYPASSHGNSLRAA